MWCQLNCLQRNWWRYSSKMGDIYIPSKLIQNVTAFIDFKFPWQCKQVSICEMPAGFGNPPGLDTYFFLNLSVGQPSNNMDLSEIEICLGTITIFFLFRKKKSGRAVYLYIQFLFQDYCVWSTLSHNKSLVFFSRGFSSVHFDVTGTRNTFQGIRKMYNIKRFNSERWKK